MKMTKIIKNNKYYKFKYWICKNNYRNKEQNYLTCKV